MMVDLRGRCTNLEFCPVAVSQRVMSLPEGSKFVCPRCGEPLQSPDAARARGLSRSGLVLQVGLALLGAGVVTYKVLEGSGGDAAPDVPMQVAGAYSPVVPANRALPLPETPLQGPVALPQPATLQPAVLQPAVLQPGALQPAAVQQPLAVPPVAVPAPQPVLMPRPAAPVPVQGPAPAQVPAQAEVAQPTKTVLLRLAGSSAIGNRLARRLSSGYLSLIGDSDIALVSGGADRAVEIVGMQTGQREAVAIASTSSAAGLAALLRGSADMAMSSRKITPVEAERLSSLGDMTASASEIVIGMQGVAAVVSPTNRLSSLTVPQLRSVLSGRTTDWSQLGGVPGPIHVYAVDNQGGAIDTSLDVLATQDDLVGTATKVASEQALAAAVATDRNGVGFTLFGSTGNAKVLSVADANASPVAPSDLSISTETYPLVQRLYLYAAPSSTNLFAKRFSAYVSSAGGQAVVEASGLVPLTVKSETAAVPDAASDRFKQLVAGATRLSVDFRFQPGSLELDGRSARDLERLVAYLKLQRVNPSRVILAGFADSNGAPAANQVVSQRRAEVVTAALSKAGIVPGKTAMFGAELPVADNATPEGRERNRRVEVYLAPQ